MCAHQWLCQGGKGSTVLTAKSAGQLAALHMTRQAGGRASEPSTLAYAGLSYNSDFGHLSARWPQTKVAKEHSFSFFMNPISFQDCSWLALFLFFFMTRDKTPDPTFVFPMLQSDNPSNYLTNTLKDFYASAPAPLVKRATPNLTPKVT